ncbi:Myosin-1 [Smittium culicis]|uniref:Myosin-1 n=1 Tax=Smittium culicis TaxID=133412 RepID=A0A1R1Y7H7_9FUNG|nr:Myosin-1 [Smittium culicis]
MAKSKPAKATWTDGASRKKQAGVSDMTLLSKITNDEISENLKKRFQNAEIYTYIGNVLISVNPFRDLGIYSPAIMSSYQGKNKLELPPHVYAIAEGSYKNMISYKENQCIIITGESGAGKTEAAKRILEYIAAVSGESTSSIQKVKEMVLATNPLLESFGNAKTLRNNNSSRFGKYLEIQFNLSGEPMGAKITNYLLEKSRVVSQIKNERNFHIFYQITKAASQKYRDMFGITNPQDYNYISSAGCIDVQNINDSSEYSDVLSSMNIIGINEQDQDNLHRLLAAILWIGNVNFTENENSESQVSNPQVVEFIAYLLQTEPEFVASAFETRTIETQRGGRRGSVYKVPLNLTQATAARDALSMAIYTRMFDWIVNRINVSLQANANVSNEIGVLDIYGFEIFEHNSFEQLCINYVNEKLQQIFIELTLKTEQEEYVREKIQWTPIEYFNNQVVCDLIESKRPPGILAAMNDACATAHANSTAADNSLKQRLNSVNSTYFELRDAIFTVKHYAGNVNYEISGMTDKNKDQLFRDHLDLCTNSTNNFLVGLFADSSNSESKKRPPTASDRIKISANELVTKLSNSQPSYIRTIKPNENKSPTEFDDRRVLHQVKYLGLCENIRVRRAGFAYRQTFDKFVERFYLLSPATSYAGEYIWRGDSLSACSQIFRDTNIDRSEWQLGVTKAFIRSPETLFALENMREKYWYNMAVRIQRAWRRYMARKNEAARKIQTAYRRNKYFIKYVQMRDYGQRILDGRKERRRYSLISYRTYFGDYLNVKRSTSGTGAITRTTLNINSSTDVIFSSEIEFLVSRQMRSAKPDNRIMVVTDQYIYIVAQVVERGLYKQQIDQKLAIVSVSKIGMSPYQDGWIVLLVDKNPSFVLKCDFKTELVTHLSILTNGRIPIEVSTKIDYYNKKQKLCKLVYTKNEANQIEIYKNKTVFIASGMPANSPSNPPTRKRANYSLSNTVSKATANAKSSRPQAPSARPIPGSRPPPSVAQQRISMQMPDSQNYSSQPNDNSNNQNPPRNSNNYSPVQPKQMRMPELSSYTAPKPSFVSADRPDIQSFKRPPASNQNRIQYDSPPSNRRESLTKNQESSLSQVSSQNQRNSFDNRQQQLASMFANQQKPSQIAKQPTSNQFQKPKPSAAQPPPPPPPPVNSNPFHKSLYDYSPQNATEMALVSNQKYEIKEKSSNGWWFAINPSGESGWIPSNYLDPNPVKNLPKPSSQAPQPPNFSSPRNNMSNYSKPHDYLSEPKQNDGNPLSLNSNNNSYQSGNTIQNDSMAKLAAALAEWPSNLSETSNLKDRANQSNSQYGNSISSSSTAQQSSFGSNQTNKFGRFQNQPTGQNQTQRMAAANHLDSDDEEAWN